MRVRLVVEVDHGLVSAGALNDLFAVAGHCVILFGNRAKDIEDNRPTAYYRVLCVGATDSFGERARRQAGTNGG
jgi:hypothetical protein